jgi:signal transduction histidine kinase
MTPRLIGRITAPVALLAGLLLIIAVATAWYIRNVQKNVSTTMAKNVASVRAAQELEISIREVRTQFDRYLITQDETHLKSIPILKKRTEDAITDAESAATTNAELTLMKRTRNGYDHFFDEYERIFRERDQWKYTKIIELIDTVLAKEILEPAHEYLRMNEGMLAKASEHNQQLADRIATGLVALGLSGAFAGLLGGIVIAISVRRSMLRTEERLRFTAERLGLAAGSLDLQDYDDEQDALEQMNVSASAVLQRLRQTERDALRAEQLAWVGQMAAGIAHEIRNPLMAIKLLVQATAERQGGSLFKPRDLQVLEEEIIRLEQIVTGFLDFARPPRVDARPTDVKDLVERTLDGIRARAELQDVRLILEPTVGPTVVSADPNQIRQVIFNLLFNALDALPQGGDITLRIEMISDQDSMPWLVLSVADTGCGIPKEMLERIFEPFVSTKESGLGLGLSICRRIAETHGGSLTVTSSPNGSCFRLMLPLVGPSAQILAPSAVLADSGVHHHA